MIRHHLSVLAALMITAPIAGAQQGYEYEVYSTHIAAPRSTALELHANYVQSGTRDIHEGVFASHRDLRSSVEVARGINKWLEASVYFVGAITREDGPQYVGNRLRVTTVAPSHWKLPFDLGLSQEVGYAQPGFAENRWMYELSPIIAKTFGALEIVLNPALETGIGGDEREIELEPRGRMSFTFGDERAVSLEYYGSLGPVNEFRSSKEQRHQLFITAQTELSERWEIGFGAGRGLTHESDRTVFSTKLEYYLGR